MGDSEDDRATSVILLEKKAGIPLCCIADGGSHQGAIIVGSMPAPDCGLLAVMLSRGTIDLLCRSIGLLCMPSTMRMLAGCVT